MHLIRISFLLFAATFMFSCTRESSEPRLSGAGKALDHFWMQRSYPTGQISMDKLSKAHTAKKESISSRNDDLTTWETMGPTNVGGRTISLAFHPENPDIIFAGSASGGLWKTTSAGIGADAWDYIPTGYPVLGIGAIAIDASNPDIMYIGTGEMYNNNLSMPGVINRLTRGSYGIGILKSEDGGVTWTKSLDWSYGEMRGVQDIVINPDDPNTLYAATSEGLYRSQDRGMSWENQLAILMAVDIKLKPNDPNTIFVTFGSLRHTETGIYRSLDGGDTFIKLTEGLPTSYSGKTLLAVDPNNPNTIYADVANDLRAIGLYRSENNGDTWSIINVENIAKWQGWFAHDIVVDPNNSNQIMRVGISVHKSTNGGLTFSQRSFNNWFGDYQAGEPEGPPTHVHSDVHGVYAHPTEANTFFFVADGGIYATTDGGLSFEGRNGGYVTTQLYPNFSNSYSDSLLAIGGLQDNSTVIFEGSDSWRRVLGGDGMCTGINFEDDNILYGSSQCLRINRSLNRGLSFSGIAPDNIAPNGNEIVNFNGPFEISLSNPDIIYAGTDRLRILGAQGDFWSSNNTLVDGNAILQMAIDPTDPDHLLLSTAPDPVSGLGVAANVYETTDGGESFILQEGLPDRLALDFAFHPEDPSVKYVVFSGFGTPHIYVTNDIGRWLSIDNGLPDLPTNSIFVDPVYPQHIYVANDLGAYVSLDGGDTWEDIMGGLPDAVYGIHLSYSPTNRKIRLATHGNGVYEAELIEPFVTATNDEINQLFKISHYPDPVVGHMNLDIESDRERLMQINLYRSTGQFVRTILSDRVRIGNSSHELNLSDLSSGVYYYKIIDQSGKFNLSKSFIKI